MRVTVLAGGIGAARFLEGLRLAAPAAQLTVIGNTADDITLHGLRVCPDLDTVMYTLGGGIHPGQGWGRAEETFTVAGELAQYGAEPTWFTLGDRDIATHVLRTRLLGHGVPLSEVTEILCRRWQPGVQLLPMSDDRVETHVLVPGDDPQAPPTAVHFQEWWVRRHGEPDAERFEFVGVESARPGPGVIEALTDADIVIIGPSNPVVSVGPILAVPGVRSALRDRAGAVVGVSPIVSGRAVRGMAESCLRTLGVEISAAGVLGMYADLIDAWLVAPQDAATCSAAAPPGVRVIGTPLLMTDAVAAAAMATQALAAAGLTAAGFTTTATAAAGDQPR